MLDILCQTHEAGGFLATAAPTDGNSSSRVLRECVSNRSCLVWWVGGETRGSTGTTTRSCTCIQVSLAILYVCLSGLWLGGLLYLLKLVCYAHVFPWSYIYLFSGNGADGFTLVQVSDECWDDSAECVSE